MKILIFLVYFGLGCPFMLIGFACGLIRSWFMAGILAEDRLGAWCADFDNEVAKLKKLK